jgi:hypothetical protein
MDIVGLSVATQYTRELLPLTSVMSQDAVLQQGVSRLQATYANIRFEEHRLLGSYAVCLSLRTNISEKRIAFIIRLKRISELGTSFLRSERASVTSYC